jgi:hypothetical protein
LRRFADLTREIERDSKPASLMTTQSCMMLHHEIMTSDEHSHLASESQSLLEELGATPVSHRRVLKAGLRSAAAVALRPWVGPPVAVPKRTPSPPGPLSSSTTPAMAPAPSTTGSTPTPKPGRPLRPTAQASTCPTRPWTTGAAFVAPITTPHQPRHHYRPPRARPRRGRTVPASLRSCHAQTSTGSAALMQPGSPSGPI